jgi:predicted MFS family arabinose efflux permease
VLRVLPNIGISNIQDHFSVGAAEIGVFSGIYYIGYTLMHIPIGLIIDRIGVKIVLPICVALTSLGLVSLIYSDVFLHATLGRLLVGIASSASVLGIFKVVQTGFGEKKFSKMVGFSVTIGLLGAMYGGMPLDNLIKIYGWHTIINFFIFFGLSFALVLPFFLPKMNHKPQPLSIKSLMQDIKTLLYNPRIILLSLIGGLMVGPVEGFADGWGTLFFQHIYDMDRQTASILPSMIFFGMCFGCIIIGHFTEKTQMHNQVVIASSAIMLVSFVAILITKCPIPLLYFLTSIIVVHYNNFLFV